MLWNEEISDKFLRWLSDQEYSPRTASGYVRGVRYVLEKYKFAVDHVLRDTNTSSPTLEKLCEQLKQDAEFVKENSTGHNYCSAALNAFLKFFKAEQTRVDLTKPDLYRQTTPISCKIDGIAVPIVGRQKELDFIINSNRREIYC